MAGRGSIDCRPPTSRPSPGADQGPWAAFSTCVEMVEALLAATPNSRMRTARAPLRPKTESMRFAVARRDRSHLARGDDRGPGRRGSPALQPDASCRRADAHRGHAAAGIGRRKPSCGPRSSSASAVWPCGLCTPSIGGSRCSSAIRTRCRHLQFLLFETDAESLKTATDGETAPMKNDSAVLLPLRQSTDYRNDADGRFHWLSRRWIYNIPRNAQTQGLRPLGRLALVDNMERVIDAVTRVVRAAIDPAGIAATAAAIGRPFRASGPPRLHRLLHDGRLWQRHRAGFRLYRSPGVACRGTARRLRLWRVGPLHRPQPAEPRSLHCQYLRPAE